MLTTLRIRNYALIGELHAEFSGGLVIITGETGAGKSIVVDALGLVLGERANPEAVRSGADRAVVEAVFTGSGSRKLHAFLAESGIEESEQLIIRREVSVRSQSRCFVNDSPVPLARLKQLGDLLVDLHGQHEHQSLLRAGTHGEMLDEFGDLGGMLEEFRSVRAALRDATERLREMRARERELREKRELLEFQIAEIDAVAPQAGEEETLAAELRILENAEQLFSGTGELSETLYGGDRSVHDLLVMCRNRLHELAAIDPEFAAAVTDCAAAETLVGELARFVRKYHAAIEFHPARLEDLRERLGKLAVLRRKYGGTLEQVLAHRNRIGSEAGLARDAGEILARLEGDVAGRRKETGDIALRLSARRKEIARRLDRAVAAGLKILGIAAGRFVTCVERLSGGEGREDADGPDFILDGDTPFALDARGCDAVEFLISTNAGEEPRPLVQIASGGEISRIMLALKSLLARSDRLPVLVFDEIDVGVSGRIAQAVGLSLKNLARYHQVVVITHLPQIAGLGDLHLLVEKKEEGGRTVTTMRPLSDEERVHEVARLLSGAEVTDAGLRGARELMNIGRER